MCKRTQGNKRRFQSRWSLYVKQRGVTSIHRTGVSRSILCASSTNEAAGEQGAVRQLITRMNIQNAQVAAAAQWVNVRQLSTPTKIQRVQFVAATQCGNFRQVPAPSKIQPVQTGQCGNAPPRKQMKIQCVQVVEAVQCGNVRQLSTTAKIQRA